VSRDHCDNQTYTRVATKLLQSVLNSIAEEFPILENYVRECMLPNAVFTQEPIMEVYRRDVELAVEYVIIEAFGNNAVFNRALWLRAGYSVKFARAIELAALQVIQDAPRLVEDAADLLRPSFYLNRPEVRLNA